MGTQVLAELSAYMQDTGLSQAAVARALGVSTAAVSTFLKGNYAGNVAEFENKIRGFLALQAERQKGAKQGLKYVATPSAQQMYLLIRMAHTECEPVALYGGAGLGKTAALKEYARQNKDSVLIETDPSFTARVLVVEIAKEIGVGVSGSLNDILADIVAKLKGSGRVLLIDEAELLPLRALEVIRRIHDKAGVGVVLAGMPRLLQNLMGRRGELKQLYSRIAYGLPLGEAVADADLGEIVKANAPKWGDEVVAKLVVLAKGNVRRLVKLVNGIRRAETLNQTVATPEMVVQFSKMLIG